MKKKILFVINHFQFSDGVAATLRSLIMNVDSNKYDIHLLPLYRLDRKFLEPVKDKVTLHRGFGFYFRGLSKLVNMIPLPLLYRMFVHGKYDLEVAYQYGMPTKMLSVSPNKHKICWMHGYDHEMVLKRYYKTYSKIVSVAREGRDKLIKEGFTNANYCHNIIDEENIIQKSSEPIEIRKSHKYVVATVCRIAPDKAILRQLRCIERSYNVTHNAEYWIIGNGPDLEKAQTYVKEHKMNNYVRLLGEQTNPFKYLANSNLFLLASTREGFNTACQEAAILGIPVVTTEVDGAQELIELAGCGEVIPNDEQSITERLTAILSDERLLSSWKKTAEINKVIFYKQPRIKKIEQVLDQTID